MNKEIYDKAKSMFPDADERTLKSICDAMVLMANNPKPKPRNPYAKKYCVTITIESDEAIPTPIIITHLDGRKEIF